MLTPSGPGLPLPYPQGLLLHIAQAIVRANSSILMPSGPVHMHPCHQGQLRPAQVRCRPALQRTAAGKGCGQLSEASMAPGATWGGPGMSTWSSVVIRAMDIGTVPCCSRATHPVPSAHFYSFQDPMSYDTVLPTFEIGLPSANTHKDASRESSH